MTKEEFSFTQKEIEKLQELINANKGTELDDDRYRELLQLIIDYYRLPLSK